MGGHYVTEIKTTTPAHNDLCYEDVNLNFLQLCYTMQRSVVLSGISAPIQYGVHGDGGWSPLYSRGNTSDGSGTPILVRCITKFDK